MGKQGIAILLVFGMAAAALADTTVYDNEADFLAAIDGGGGFLLEDFDGYVYGGFTGWTLDIGPMDGYAGTISAHGGDESFLWSGDGNMSTNNALDYLQVDFTGNPTYSTAGWFFASDVGGYYIPGTIVITLSNAFEYEFNPPNGTDFRGFVTTEPIDWVKIDALDDSVNRWSTMDHYYIDSPEPASLSLLALGALALLRRR